MSERERLECMTCGSAVVPSAATSVRCDYCLSLVLVPDDNRVGAAKASDLSEAHARELDRLAATQRRLTFLRSGNVIVGALFFPVPFAALGAFDAVGATQALTILGMTVGPWIGLTGMAWTKVASSRMRERARLVRLPLARLSTKSVCISSRNEIRLRGRGDM